MFTDTPQTPDRNPAHQDSRFESRRHALISAYASGDSIHIIADNFNLPLADLLAFFLRPDIKHTLGALAEFSVQRARHLACFAQSASIAAFTTTLNTYIDDECTAAHRGSEASPILRQRQRETAVRVAATILRIGGLLPQPRAHDQQRDPRSAANSADHPSPAANDEPLDEHFSVDAHDTHSARASNSRETPAPAAPQIDSPPPATPGIAASLASIPSLTTIAPLASPFPTCADGHHDAHPTPWGSTPRSTHEDPDPATAAAAQPMQPALSTQHSLCDEWPPSPSARDNPAAHPDVISCHHTNSAPGIPDAQPRAPPLA